MSARASQGSIKRPGIGQCIYCGTLASVTKLGEEHVIALSLGGNLIMEDASCRDCEKKTSYIDGVCGRAIFPDARAHFGLIGRRRKNKSRPFQVIIGTPQKHAISHLDPATHPLYVALPVFRRPGLWAGDKRTDIAVQSVHVFTNSEMLRRHSRLPRSIGIPIRTHIPTFYRMLAKVAHSYACMELGTEIFNHEMMLTDIILGRSTQYAHLIGDAEEDMPQEELDDEFVLHDIGIKTPSFRNCEWIICHIMLFCPYGTPVYEVVVGKAKNRTNAVAE